MVEKQNPAADGIRSGASGCDRQLRPIDPADKSPTAAQQARGARNRRKGARIELEMVHRHIAIGIHAEKVPLSGAARYRGGRHDVDVYAFGQDDAPLVCEVKGRKTGGGFITIESWLGEHDALFLRRNNADPLVVLPWRVWQRFLRRTHA